MPCGLPGFVLLVGWEEEEGGASPPGLALGVGSIFVLFLLHLSMALKRSSPTDCYFRVQV